MHRATEPAISVAGDAPADETNLCLRAQAAYREAAPRVGPHRVELEKRIPTGGGLGGGSGNAAGVLLALEPLNPDR